MKRIPLRTWLTMAVIVCLALFLASCGKPEPAELAQKILGECRNDTSSGAHELDINDDNTWLTVTYHFYRTGSIDVKEEVGVELARKIEKLYKEIPTLDTAQFVVQRPYSDNKGNVSWLKDAHFTFTRKTYESINWKNFAGSQLLDVAERPWWKE